MYKIMKKISLIFLYSLVAYSILAISPQTIKLHSGWKVAPSEKVGTDATLLDSYNDWYDAKVPSTAMGVLMGNGVYPANFLDGLTYRDVDKTRFDKPWWWTTEFSLPGLTSDNQVTLNLDGITYRTDIWVNGKKVADSSEIFGPFRRHSIDITPYINSDRNTLSMLVYRAQPGEPNIGFVDWNPRPADENLGVFRPVSLSVTKGAKIKDPAVKSRLNKNDLSEAWLTVESTVSNLSDRPVEGKLVASYEGGKAIKNVNLSPGETSKVTITPDDAPQLYIKNPRIWWPHNLGNQEMYTLNLSFIIDGTEADNATVDFGIREIDEYFTSDNQRGFKVNGKPVLIRSAGWTDDIFLRNDSSRYETELEYVKQMNLNSVRLENIWGTDQYLYDLCDRLGLLVFTGWSCHWEWEDYLGSPVDEFGGIKSAADMDLISKSFADQVSWLRNHPSIIGWFEGSDMMPRPELEKRYVAILDSLDNRPYISSAKEMTSTVTGPSGTKMAGPYDYVAPNYWYSPEAPGGAWGWNTETGIGAQLPQKESILRMIPSEQLWPMGEAWNYHCTASQKMHTLDVLTDVINKKYGEATSLDDYLRKADWINYDGTRTMFEAFRVNIPRATGIVQWMLNSAWPSLYWQLYDYYLVPTSSYYSLRRSNTPVQLIYDYGRRAVYAVNESNSVYSLRASMKRYPVEGGEMTDENAMLEIQPYTVVKAFDIGDLSSPQFVFLRLTDSAGQGEKTTSEDSVVAENFYILTPEQDLNDFSGSNWYITPITRHADCRFLNSLPPSDVSLQINKDDNKTVKISLKNNSDNVAFFNRLTATDSEGNLIVPALWSDNYVSLQPHETKNITCTFSSAEEASEADISLHPWR